MGNSSLPDWGPTRNPARNAEISAENAVEERRAQAYAAETKEKRAKFLPAAISKANDKIETYLGFWKEDVDAMINSVPTPTMPEARQPWYVALAGNLLWAGTCFLNPAAADFLVMSRVMSVSGAVFGSGVMSVPPEGSNNPPASGPKSPKQLLLTAVALAKGQLESHFKSMRREWASEFPHLLDWNESGTTVLDSFDAYVWRKMFPWIPFDDTKDAQIQDEALRMVNSVFADYMRQWQVYLRSNPYMGESEMARHADRDFYPVLRPSFHEKALWLPEPPLKVRRE